MIFIVLYIVDESVSHETHGDAEVVAPERAGDVLRNRLSAVMGIRRRTALTRVSRDM